MYKLDGISVTTDCTHNLLLPVQRPGYKVIKQIEPVGVQNIGYVRNLATKTDVASAEATKVK